MALRISHTSVDSHDAYAQSRWWSEVLGYSEDSEDPNLPGHEECLIISPDGAVRVLFIEVPEKKSVKNRLHFDLRPTDVTRRAEVDRVRALGATHVADFIRPDGTGWVVLADPEGNEFCILTGQPELDALGL
ncbi:VOC family protein [Paramicrobacterium fandaimingii]|uniref:VOC family protein n=1 Tax=Paramicrobacterium fandaimingii TaxID=2708079 RepID=UPI0014248922|nr:VOC family protein [Microbacterium fandaimingii]